EALRKTGEAWKANCQSNLAAMHHVEEAFGQILHVGVKSGDHRADPEPMTWAEDVIDAMHAVKARATAAEAARQEALMQSIADAGQAQEAHDARLRAEAEREALVAAALERAASIRVDGEPDISPITRYAIAALATQPQTDALA